MKNEETKRQPLAPVSILHSSFCLHTFPCGALVDERGNVIGIVSAKLDASTALAMSGSLPENVNYAVKSSLLMSFLESVPDVSAKLKAPNTKDEKFEDVVKSAQDAAVLVLVY
jgi:S1-C subfamily serine protease